MPSSGSRSTRPVLIGGDTVRRHFRFRPPTQASASPKARTARHGIELDLRRAVEMATVSHLPPRGQLLREGALLIIIILNITIDTTC